MPPRAIYRDGSEDDAELQTPTAMPTLVPSANESKRDRRRRDMQERIERLRREGIERREQTFHHKLSELHDMHLGLLARPYPTDPIYLLRLHEISIQRDAMLAAAKTEADRAREQAEQIHKSDIERIQEEYESGRRTVVDKLNQACIERQGKLLAEKDSLELNLDTLFDPAARPHATRRIRLDARALANGTEPGAPPNLIPLPPHGEADLPPFGHSVLASSPMVAGFASAAENGTPASIAALYAALASAGAFASVGLGGSLGPAGAYVNGAAIVANPAATGPGLRTARKRQIGGPGGPDPNKQWSITPGKYEQFGKALVSLQSLKADEMTEDLEQMRRKRRRGTQKARRFVEE